MTYKTILLTIITFSFFVDALGQNSHNEKKYLIHDGLVSDMKICIDCDLNTIVKSIKNRIANYPIDTNTEFRKEKGDTLIEIISFNKNMQPDYSYYNNNFLKIRFTQTDSSEFTLTVMNDFEMEQKQWYVSPKEIHITDYDTNSNVTKYFAEIYPDNNTKIEFEKTWESSKFQKGQSKTYKKESSIWKLQKTETVGQFDWPQNTESLPLNVTDIEGEWRINTFITWDSYKQKKYLIENHDTITKDYGIILSDGKTVISKPSFLPYKLKSGLQTGNYTIYEKDYEKRHLLIDAKILAGKLHGVYNEYDLKTGKIKIYAVYKLGKLDGRRTIYFYNKNGGNEYKITELWDNGKYIGLAH